MAGINNIKMKPAYKQFLLYSIKFLAVFAVVYFGTIAWIGLAAPGNYYCSFIDHHLDYITWLRNSLLQGSKYLLSLFNYQSQIPDAYSLQIVNGKAVHIGYDCIGYGVMSFWLAFIIANKGTWIRKLLWITAGLIIIWLINITRISMMLVALNKNKTLPFKLDNHTFFNILAYIAIFIMIFIYDKQSKKATAK